MKLRQPEFSWAAAFSFEEGGKIPEDPAAGIFHLSLYRLITAGPE
jgi:hypothetical protein